MPAGVSAEPLGLRKLLALGELDPDRGQHRAPVADVGTAYRSLVARFEGRAVRPVVRDDVFNVSRRHGLQANGSSVGKARRLAKGLQDLFRSGLVDRYGHGGE